MKHQTQGWNECLPTSIAVCLGIDKDEFIESCLMGTRYNFWAEVPNHERNELISLALHYWGEDTPDEWLDLMEENPQLLAYRTGLLAIWDEDGEKGHAVAIDRGIVFDPAHEGGPVPWALWALSTLLCGFVPIGFVPTTP